MATVYVIQDAVGDCYVGITENYSQRRWAHKSRRVFTTKHMVAPRKCMHKWECPDIISAAKLESFLHKSMKGSIAAKDSCTILFDIILDCPIYNSTLANMTKSICIDLTKY